MGRILPELETASRHNFTNRIARHIRQTEVTTVLAISQSCVIQTHGMQDRCVDVVHANSLLHCLEPNLIGCSVPRTSTNPAASHPGCKCVWVVVSSGPSLLDQRQSPELSTTNYERRLQ